MRSSAKFAVYAYLTAVDAIGYFVLPLTAIAIAEYASSWQSWLTVGIAASWAVFLVMELINRRIAGVGILFGIITMDYHVRGFGLNLIYRLSLAVVQLALTIWAFSWPLDEALRQTLILSFVAQELVMLYIHRGVWLKAKIEAKQRWSSLLVPR